MTLRFSPVQADIITFLKTQGSTPEDFAKARGLKLSTVLVQLARARRKDREARIFHATYNGLMGGNPNLRQWLKVQEPAYPVPLTPGEREVVDRHLQNLVVRQPPVGKHRRNGRPKHHGVTARRKRNKPVQRSVKRRGRR